MAYGRWTMAMTAPRAIPTNMAMIPAPARLPIPLPRSLSVTTGWPSVSITASPPTGRCRLRRAGASRAGPLSSRHRSARGIPLADRCREDRGPALEAPALRRRQRPVGGDAVIDTDGQPVVTDKERGNGMGRRAGAGIIAMFVGIALGAVMAMVHLPYAILQPGPVTNTLGNGSGSKPLITVAGNPTYPTTGALDFT